MIGFYTIYDPFLSCTNCEILVQSICFYIGRDCQFFWLWRASDGTWLNIMMSLHLNPAVRVVTWLGLSRGGQHTAICQEFFSLLHMRTWTHIRAHSQALWTDLQLPEEVIILGLSCTTGCLLKRKRMRERKLPGNITIWQNDRDRLDDMRKEKKVFPHQQVSFLYQYLQYHKEVWTSLNNKSVKTFLHKKQE